LLGQPDADGVQRGQFATNFSGQVLGTLQVLDVF